VLKVFVDFVGNDRYLHVPRSIAANCQIEHTILADGKGFVKRTKNNALPMKLNEILDILRRFAPEDSALAADPVGLHIGDLESEITRVGVCLDATLPVVRKAVAQMRQLVVSHHPLLYHPLRRIVSTDPVGAAPIELVRANASLYVMHTNWDGACGGINDSLANCLELQEVRRLSGEGDARIARIGNLPSALSGNEFLKHVGSRLECQGTSTLRFAQADDAPRAIRRVAICGGAGGFLIEAALAARADAFVTADVRHHEFVSASAFGLMLIDAGHQGTESPGMRRLAEILSSEIPSLDVAYLP
jgi:dinuclear metal center YbgI/SA1388 family protein